MPPSSPDSSPQRRVDVADNSGAIQGSFNTTVYDNKQINVYPSGPAPSPVPIANAPSSNIIGPLAVLGIVALVVIVLIYLATTREPPAVPGGAVLLDTPTATLTPSPTEDSTATPTVAASAEPTAADNAAATSKMETSTALAGLYERGIAAVGIGDMSAAYDYFRRVFDVDPNFQDVQAQLKALVSALTPAAPLAIEKPATSVPLDPSTPAATRQTTDQGSEVRPTPSAASVSTSTPTSTATPTATPLATPSLTQSSAVTPAQPATATALSAAPSGSIRVVAEGNGSAPADQTSAALRRRFAILAATADAKRNLAAWIEGEQVEAVTVVTDGVVVQDEIRIQVKALLKNVNVISETYDDTTRTAVVLAEIVVPASAP